ncbi:MAG TPA: HAD family hydrolase, partial [Bacillota bacterium]|nr:HAD family hydrolase [Bacillota bacterium]
MSQKAVFLDRDGVINDNSKSVDHPEDLILFPWAGPAIRRLNQAGYLVFIVTNQGGVELGFLTEAELAAIHSHLEALLREHGAKIDEIVYCPHFHEENDCRKPKPGMIQSLAAKYPIILPESWMIGDRESDIQAGNAAGCRTIKLGKPSPQADFT